MCIKYHIILLKTQQTEDKYSKALINLQRKYSNFKFSTIEPIKFKQLRPNFKYDSTVPVVFTSPRAVVHFSSLIDKKKSPRQIFTVGPSTTDTVKHTYNSPIEIIEYKGTGSNLASNLLLRHQNIRKVLYPCAANPDGGFSNTMKEKIEVETLAVYDNVADLGCLERVENLIKSRDLQFIIMYFSPLGLKSVPVENLLQIKNDIKFVSIGSTTTSAFPNHVSPITLASPSPAEFKTTISRILKS